MRLDDWVNSELSLAESWACVSDGLLHILDDSFYLSDVSVTASIKLKQLFPYDAHKYAACGLTALWVHGYCPRPCRPRIAMRTSVRPDHYYLDRFTVRDIGPIQSDCINHSNFYVLTLQRALLEVTTDPQLDNYEVAEVLARVRYAAPHELQATYNAAKAPRQPYRTLMRKRLALADAIDVVDGLNAANSI